MQPIRELTISAADLDSLPAVTPADILRGAALYLETRGWFQNYYFQPSLNPFPKACVEGAIQMAAFGSANSPSRDDAAHRDRNRAQNALTDYLVSVGAIDPTFFDRLGDIVPIDPTDDDQVLDFDRMPDCAAEWNDINGRSAGEVIAALRSAADEWDRQHAITYGGDQS